MGGKFWKRCVPLVLTAALLWNLGGTALALDDVPAPSAVLMEAGTGRVLYEKNAHEQRPCASITKVMTLLLVMEALDAGKIKLEDQVAASAHAASMGGSDIWLKEGEVMTVDDLLKATVIMSANDAAVVLAEYVAGSEEDFVSQMNQRAAQLGMEDTVFKNCNGLDEDGHVTSAYDVALMSRALIAHEKIFDYSQVWMDSVRNGETQLVNTNKLLKTYDGITGLKTGTTGGAGVCISASATRNGLNLIAVVLGANSSAERFEAATKLLDYGFANYEAAALPDLSGRPLYLAVTGSGDTEIPLDYTELPGRLLVPSGGSASLEASISLPESCAAPVSLGDQVGTVTVTSNGETVGSWPIRAAADAARMDFDTAVRLMLESLF